MESVKMRAVTAATKREYRRMELVGEEEGEELDEAEWLHRAEAQSQRRRRGQRYAFCCALFASLNGILLGYGATLRNLGINSKSTLSSGGRSSGIGAIAGSTPNGTVQGDGRLFDLFHAKSVATSLLS